MAYEFGTVGCNDTPRRAIESGHDVPHLTCAGLKYHVGATSGRTATLLTKTPITPSSKAGKGLTRSRLSETSI